MVGNPTSTVDLERPRAVVTVEFQQQRTEENMHGVQVLLGQPSHPVNPKKQKRCEYPIEPTSNLFFGSTLDSLVGNWVTQNNLVPLCRDSLSNTRSNQSSCGTQTRRSTALSRAANVMSQPDKDRKKHIHEYCVNIKKNERQRKVKCGAYIIFVYL